MQAPETIQRCALCEEPLTPEGGFCPKCGAESMKLRVKTPGPGLQFCIQNHFWVVLLIASVVFGVSYRITEKTGMIQTYALFAGIPLLIGVLVAYLTRPQSGIGTTLKITTILLCIVCPFLGEGSICILMASPLFYAFAIGGYYLVAFVMNMIRPNRRGGPLAVVLIPFIMAMQTSDRSHIDNLAVKVITDRIFVAASPERVMETLQRTDIVATDFPVFLKLGFPLPTRMERDPDGLTHLHFDPRSEPWRGTNTILSRQTVDNVNRTVIFEIVEDGTKLARWMTFRSTGFKVVPCKGGSALYQTTIYEQRMQPGFYWNTTENFAMGQMHGYALRNLKKLAEATNP